MKNENLLASIDKKIEDFYQSHMEDYFENLLDTDIPSELVLYKNKTNLHFNEFLGLCQHYDFDVLKVILFKKESDVKFERILSNCYSRPLFFCALFILHPQGKVKVQGFPRRCLIGILNKNKTLFSIAKKIQQLLK